MRIGSNISALIAQRRLGSSQKAIARSLERLASGKRINRASDDPAGLAISTGLNASLRALNQVNKDINTANALFTTLDSAMQSQTEILQRIRELALQSSNGILSDQERGYLDDEVQSLFAEFSRITE